MTTSKFLSLVGIGFAAAGCSRETAAPDQPTVELRVLCGSSMAAPIQELCRLFQEQQGVNVSVDLGGSETLLPRILSGAAADVFVSHDPFEQKVKEAGRWAGSATVGHLRPVLLVRPGNPRQVKSVGDLTNRTLKIGIGDPRYSTCGELFVDLLKQRGQQESVMSQVALQGRSHAEIANGMIMGPLDAVVVWNYVARLYQGKVEEVPTTDPYPEIKVTVVGLTQSQQAEWRDAFLTLCRSATAERIFDEHGYGVRAATGPANPAP